MSPASPGAGGDRRRRLSGRTWADLGVLLALTLIGIVGFEPSFGGYGFLLAGLGGLVVGAATGIVAAVLRLPAVLTALAAIVAYFLLGTAFAVPRLGLLGVLPTLPSLTSVAIGSVFGWGDILTIGTPIGAPQHIAVVPYAAAWIVALVSTTLACRWLPAGSGATWRPAIALAAPLALYLGGILVGTEEPYLAALRGVAFAVIALAWLGWRRPSERTAPPAARRPLRRRLAGALVVVLGAVLVGGAAAVWLAPPGEQRLVLRREIVPPFDPLDYPSPLAGYRHYTKDAVDEALFTVEGLRPGDRVRLATMDAYTGKLWNVTDPVTDAEGSGSFALVGRRLPAPALVTPDARADVTFTIEGYSDIWVPGLGYPSDIEFTAGPAVEAVDDLRYNAATGTLALVSGLQEGDRYTIDATVQRPVSVGELGEAQTAPVVLSPVDGVPDVVTTKAEELAGSADTPIAQLEAIRLALVNDGFLSHGRASDAVPSRAGHGADRISELFERSRMVGDEEQYATAFALMARSLGYPARVVMGFAPEIADGQDRVEVTGDDVTAWVEVAFDGVGWVPFDPTPDETDVPQDQVPKPQSQPQPQVRQPPRAEGDEEDLLSPVELEDADDEDEGEPFRLPGWLVPVALGVLIPAAVVLVPLLVIGAIKAARVRRRRSRGPGHDRAAGAWEELADRYQELGYEVPRRSTRTAVAERLEQQLGPEGPPLRGLAAVTDEAVFSGREVDEARSEVVWTEAMAAVEAGRAAVGAARRIASRFRLRSASERLDRLLHDRGPEDRG